MRYLINTLLFTMLLCCSCTGGKSKNTNGGAAETDTASVIDKTINFVQLNQLTPAQEQSLELLTGKYYKEFRRAGDAEGKVQSIVMTDDADHLAAAFANAAKFGKRIFYFSNAEGCKSQMPKALQAWANGFSDYPVVYRSGDTIALKPLAEERYLCYEDEEFRVSGQSSQTSEAFIQSIEPKYKGMKSYILDDTNGFLGVAGNVIVVNLGTNEDADVIVYNIWTGEKKMTIGCATNSLEPGSDGESFTIYFHGECYDTPYVYWDKDAKSWKTEGRLPKGLKSDELDKLKREKEEMYAEYDDDELTEENYRLIPYRQVAVDLNKWKEKPLDKYTWILPGNR